MDVIINYGIKYKKCAQVSYSGYQRKSLLAHLLHHIIHQNKEISYALIAELHCSSYYKDIENFFIHYLSNYVLYNDISLAFFIYHSIEKIKMIKKILSKSYRNIGLINSNEIRNIYSTIISKLLASKIISKHNTIKIGNKSHHSEHYLIYSNLIYFG